MEGRPGFSNKGSIKLVHRFILTLVLLGIEGFALGAFDGSHIERAIETWDRALLGEALREVEAEAKRSPLDEAGAYWHGVAAFHSVLMETPPSDEVIDSSVETVRKAIRLNPDRKDTQAMLCVLYGMRIQKNRIRAIWLGPRVMGLGKKALAIPEDPRALYLVAACRYFGGQGKKDLEEALRLLTRAETLFDLEKSTPTQTAPRWGSQQCIRFKKLVLEKLAGKGQ